MAAEPQDSYQSLYEDSVDQRYREDEFIIEKFRQNAAEIGLHEAKSLMSVGPGTGILDRELIEACCPNLQRYIAVDENDPLLQQVNVEMSGYSDKLKVELVNSALKDYEGPTEPVDIIFLSHILYYVHNYGHECKRMYEWLNPGGAMIIVINRGDGEDYPNLYIEMAVKLSGNVPSPLGVNSESVKRWLIQNEIPHTREYRVKSQILIHPGPSLKQLVQFILMGRDASEETVQMCLETMKKYCKPETDICEEETVIMVVKKPL